MAGITDAVAEGEGMIQSLVNSVAGPLINNAQAEKYETEYQDYLRGIADAANLALGSGSGVPFDDVSERLCVAGGVPSPGSVGPYVNVPLGRLVALLSAVAGGVRSGRYQAQFIHKAVS